MAARYNRLPVSPPPLISLKSSTSSAHSYPPSSNGYSDEDDDEYASETATLVGSTPTSRHAHLANDVRYERDALHSALQHDHRFDMPTPSPWARAALIAFVVFLFWLGYAMRIQGWLGERD